MKIYKYKSLRRIIIPLLKLLNPGTIVIKHHYTKKKFSLNAFRHKGYWYHGKRRELFTMNFFKKLIKHDFTVMEVGGHIGYITNYFSSLTPNGKIYVFEPGINNLPYLKKNIQNLQNVTLLTQAVSNKNGKAKFYIENLSGQNNSLLSEYKNGEAVKNMSFVKTNKEEVEVETITLDSFCESNSIKPDFIKIDIEGAEILALQGMSTLLKKDKPLMMIEITENWNVIKQMLKEIGYKLFNDKKEDISDTSFHSGNTFCLI